MALSRKTKKALKAYASWKVLRTVAGFGVVPAAGLALFQYWKSRHDDAAQHS